MLPVDVNLRILSHDIELRQRLLGGLTPEEIAEWGVRNRKISEYWDWFTGEALEELDKSEPADKNGNYPLKYPLQINFFGIASRLHAYALWGDVEDGATSMAKTMVDVRKGDSREVAEHIEDVLEQIDYENAARAQDLDMGLSIQSLGGIALKVSWDPTDIMLGTGIRYEYFDPRCFYARTNGRNYWNLKQAWIAYTISPETALSYGVEPQRRDSSLYVEYWDAQRYVITVDGQVARDENGPLERDHGYGFVPFVYVPHERVNSFWGTSIVHGLIGMMKELNAREADIGDAIQEGINDILFVRNTRGAYPVRKRLPDGGWYYELGMARSKGDAEPDMRRVGAPKLPEGSDRFIERLQENLRILLYTPDISYGKEEGSQRSGRTLYSRMWPLLSHVQTERSLWTQARNLRAEMALRILASKGRSGITEAHLGRRKYQAWAPQVPMDRAELVDELIRRKQEGAISDELLVERFGDAPDKRLEVERIREMQETAARLERMKFVTNNPQAKEAGDVSS